MKKLVIILAMAALALMTTQALAFHDQGVARCAGCHTMHNSENGALVDPNSPNGNPYLLRDGSASDVCLSCHATSRGAVWGADPMNPPVLKGAGNFAFLAEDNVNDGHNGHLNPIPGRATGHNVVAPSRNSGPDPVLTQAPGGTYPADALGCSSCHDPHGTNSFRLLYGISHVEAGDYQFTNPSPDAEGINFSNATPEANNYHTAYRGGMSAWCANCHGNYHQNDAMLVHPSGRTIGGSIANTYNRYNGSSDLTGGTAATAYLASVPFEDAAMTIDNTAGPSAASQVSCISCHRAHATSAPNAGRWDFNVGLLAEDGHESGSYAIPNPYDEHQRSLCNKCHAKDVNDALITAE